MKGLTIIRNDVRTLAVTLLMTGLLTACASHGGHQAPAPLDLTVLHINDQHSNLDHKNRTLQLRSAAGKRVPVSVDVAGFPRITTAFTELAADKDNVLKLHAGDALTGTLYFNRAGEPGEADAALMNIVCFDAFTLGNHEFDKGDTALHNWLALLNSGACQTPVLSANVQFGSHSALHPDRASHKVQPYTVVERDGQKIGIVGLTVSGKTKSGSSPDPDTTFDDETVAAQRTIDALRHQGINKIILLTHIGYSSDKQLLAELSGVDVVIGGDSHSLLGPDTLATYGVGSPIGPYPTMLTNLDGDHVCLAQAWEYAQIMGELHVTFDKSGRVTSCTGTPHVLIGDNFAIDGKPVSATDRVAIDSDIHDSGFLRVTAPDVHATAVLRPYKESVNIYKETVVGTVPLTLCSRRTPGGAGSADYGRSSPQCNAEGSVNVRGGDIQQLVAQAYLEAANMQYGGADFSLQNAGGVRTPLHGTVTAANVIEVLPFDNQLWKLSITGAEARAMIEDGLDAVFGHGGSTGPYPYTGGLRWHVDANQPKGSRASNFEVFHRPSGTWRRLEDSRHYTLFTLSFIVDGGNGYATLANLPEERRMDIGILDADMFLSYIDSLPKGPSGVPVIQPLDHSLYSTQSFIGPATP